METIVFKFEVSPDCLVKVPEGMPVLVTAYAKIDDAYKATVGDISIDASLAKHIKYWDVVEDCIRMEAQNKADKLKAKREPRRQYNSAEIYERYTEPQLANY